MSEWRLQTGHVTSQVITGHSGVDLQAAGCPPDQQRAASRSFSAPSDTKKNMKQSR